jgi:hypothetical protein
MTQAQALNPFIEPDPSEAPNGEGERGEYKGGKGKGSIDQGDKGTIDQGDKGDKGQKDKGELKRNYSQSNSFSSTIEQGDNWQGATRETSNCHWQEDRQKRERGQKLGQLKKAEAEAFLKKIMATCIANREKFGNLWPKDYPKSEDDGTGQYLLNEHGERWGYYYKDEQGRDMVEMLPVPKKKKKHKSIFISMVAYVL